MSAATMTRPSPTAPSVADEAIPFSRLVRVEWGKATDTRAARWLIVVSLAATALIMLAPLLADTKIDQSYGAYVQFASFGLASLLPVVTILTMTSEWSQRTVLATFTQEPRRNRVISAKVTVALIMTVLAIAYGLMVAGVGLAISDAVGRDVYADFTAGNGLGFALFILLNIMMGVAFGALLHNSPAAIVLFFILPAVFGFLGATVTSVGRWIDTGTTFNWVLEGHWSGHVPNIAASVALWVVLPLVAGLVRTARREIK